MPIGRPRATIRSSKDTICLGVTELPRKRQRKSSVQRVSGDPSGQTLTPRLAIISRARPSPDALPMTAARLFGSREGHSTYTSTPTSSILGAGLGAGILTGGRGVVEYSAA